jgi:hypothetical protein
VTSLNISEALIVSQELDIKLFTPWPTVENWRILIKCLRPSVRLTSSPTFIHETNFQQTTLDKVRIVQPIAFCYKKIRYCSNKITIVFKDKIYPQNTSTIVFTFRDSRQLNLVPNTQSYPLYRIRAAVNFHILKCQVFCATLSTFFIEETPSFFVIVHNFFGELFLFNIIR